MSPRTARAGLATVVTVVATLAALVLAGHDDRDAAPTAAAGPPVASAVLPAAATAHPEAPAAPAPPARPAPVAPPAAPGVPPAVASLPAATTQAVVVRTTSPTATRGDLALWTRAPGGAWTRALGPVPAWVGDAGTGASSESSDRTPAGTFGLTRSFGRAANPGTALPWFHAGPDDWWVSDARSRAYNTHQVCRRGTCPFDEKAGENLDAAGAAYDDAVVIDANTSPVVPGRGSAYFLHVGSAPTVGCVATDRATVVAVMRRLTPAAHPVITIGR